MSMLKGLVEEIAEIVAPGDVRKQNKVWKILTSGKIRLEDIVDKMEGVEILGVRVRYDSRERMVRKI